MSGQERMAQDCVRWKQAFNDDDDDDNNFSLCFKLSAR